MIPAPLQNGLVLAGLVAVGILGLVVVWQITKSLIKLLFWLVALGLLVTGVLYLIDRLA